MMESEHRVIGGGRPFGRGWSSPFGRLRSCPSYFVNGLRRHPSAEALDGVGTSASELRRRVVSVLGFVLRQRLAEAAGVHGHQTEEGQLYRCGSFFGDIDGKPSSRNCGSKAGSRQGRELPRRCEDEAPYTFAPEGGNKRAFTGPSVRRWSCSHEEYPRLTLETCPEGHERTGGTSC